jgi:anti-sigma regulatory factor (Ser/Thr protein kinase)
MSTVELRFSALPSHVRTARLVAAAVARRAGVDESLLDEVRLAVGEACSRAVGLHRRNRPDEPVTVNLILQTGRFSIEVCDRVPASHDPVVSGLGAGPHSAGIGTPAAQGEETGGGIGLAPARTHGDGAALGGSATTPTPALGRDPVVAEEGDHVIGEHGDLLPGSMGLAVISGLVDDLAIRSGSDGVVIRMSWPAASGEGGPQGAT